MDVQYELWKTELAQGQTIKIPVNSDRLEPLLSRGDSVEVRKVPMKQVVLNDVVFCQIGGKVGLRKITQVRALYGNHAVEITDDDGAAKPLAESALLGKVIRMHRRNQTPTGPTPGEKFLRTLKRFLLPGT